MTRPLESDLDERIIQVNRVSRKTKGGNAIGFSVLTVVGDRKGEVGIGLGKAPDVTGAIKKSFRRARRSMFKVHLRGRTIPHWVEVKYKAARVLLKPAPPGTGVIAGGAVRAVVEAAGIRDVVSKILGSDNKLTNVKATIQALKQLRPPKRVGKRRSGEVKTPPQSQSPRLEDLSLSTKTLDRLRKAGLENINDLTKENLVGIKGVGVKKAAEIINQVKELTS